MGKAIDISRADPVKVLMVLYERAKPQGMGFMHFTAGPLSVEEAKELFLLHARPDGKAYFDYVKGRVMKVGIAEGQPMETWLYDRDNGEGAAFRALKSAGLDVSEIEEK